LFFTGQGSNSRDACLYAVFPASKSANNPRTVRKVYAALQPVARTGAFELGGTINFILPGKDPEPTSASHPKTIRGESPEELDQLVAKATATKAETRFSSAAELKQQLTQTVHTLLIPPGECSL